jgi:hypothetical protein
MKFVLSTILGMAAAIKLQYDDMGTQGPNMGPPGMNTDGSSFTGGMSGSATGGKDPNMGMGPTDMGDGTMPPMKDPCVDAEDQDQCYADMMNTMEDPCADAEDQDQCHADMMNTMPDPCADAEDQDQCYLDLMTGMTQGDGMIHMVGDRGPSDEEEIGLEAYSEGFHAGYDYLAATTGLPTIEEMSEEDQAALAAAVVAELDPCSMLTDADDVAVCNTYLASHQITDPSTEPSATMDAQVEDSGDDNDGDDNDGDDSCDSEWEDCDPSDDEDVLAQVEDSGDDNDGDDNDGDDNDGDDSCDS